jgi:hypothetical protein
MKIRTGEAFPGLRQINGSGHSAPSRRVPIGTMKNAGLYETIRADLSARVLPVIFGPGIRAAPVVVYSFCFSFG